MMRFCHVILAVAIGILAFTLPIRAAEIEGQVSEVADGIIKIATASDLLPAEGDSVKIYVEIEGIGQAEVGSGRVKGVEDDVIVAEITQATGRVQKGQKAIIDSPKPVRRAGIKVPVVIGQAAQDAKAAIAAVGLEAEFQIGMAPPTGVRPYIVYAQDPPAGSQLASGGKVVITLYAGEPGTAPTEPSPPPPEPSPPPPEPMEGASSDYERIQGAWICVKTTHDGKRVENYVGVRMIFEGENLTWYFPRPDGTESEQKARYRIDPAQSPKHLDWFPVDDAFQVHKRLYVLEGGTLKMSANLGTKPRPATFAGGAWQFTCRRIQTASESAASGVAPPEGEAVKPWIGAVASRVDRVVAKRLKLDRAAGALMEGLWVGSPAEKAGLLENDVVVAVDDHSIEFLKELGANIQSHAVGDEVHLSLVRDGQPMEVGVKLESMPSGDGLLLRVQEAVNDGRIWATFRLGLAYESGKLVEKDEGEAVKLYRKAADQGYARAQHRLGTMYENGRGVSQDFAEAAKWYGEAALQEYAMGENALGWLYQNGKGVAQDDAEAVRWYRKAAERGHDVGQIKLGWMYHQGRGVDRDYAQALRWYRQAADQGNASAQFNIGVMHAEGLGVAKDDVEAVRWFQMAADAGIANAQTYLGVMFQNGRGVQQDFAEALKWHRRAAEKGDSFAYANLGLLYQRGEGVARDYGEAIGMYNKARALGSVRASYNLGLMYANGRGVGRDTAIARDLINEAAVGGLPEARQTLQQLDASR